MAISTTSHKTNFFPLLLFFNLLVIQSLVREKKKKRLCMGMHLKALQCPKRLSLVSNFQNTFYNFLFSWLAACLLPLDSQLIISQLIITPKKWIDFNKHLTSNFFFFFKSEMDVSSWSRISLWLCSETSGLHVLACSHAFFYSHFAPTLFLKE